MKKIVHITTYPPKGSRHAKTGGVSSYSKNLITNLSRQGGEMVVLCEKSGGERVYFEDNVRIERIFDRNILFAFQIYKKIREIKPDVIHIQQELNLFGGPITAYFLHWLVYFLAKRSKVIVTLHGVVDLSKVDEEFVRQNNSSLPTWIVKIALRLIYMPLCMYAHVIVVHEEKFKKLLITEYGADSTQIVVIPHGVEDLKPIDKSIARKELGISSDKHAVLFMGYLTGYKGVDILIEGFAEYAKSDPVAYLVVGAGKHPKLKDDSTYLAEYKQLEEKAKNMIPSNQYVWKGFIEEKDIALYYSACDVSVYPYTIQMSSSGPMAIAIGYDKPFLGSSAFEGVLEKELIFGTDSNELTKALRLYFTTDNRSIQDAISNKRAKLIWPRIAELHADLYRKEI